jgi:hypothetical protein
MGAVVSAIEDVVGGVVDAVGSVASAVVDAAETVVTKVVDTAEKVVDTALKDPIGTIAKVAAVATGQLELLPVISAADTVAHGGSLADAALSAGISYVAPTVASGFSDAMADTAIGDALKTASESTGIDNLSGAVAKGASTAALNTAAGVLKGQDLETALQGGVTSGIGAGVGNAVTSEIAGSDFDTGNKGINSLLGNAAGAATTAELRGKDVSTAIANSVAPGILGLGAGAAYDAATANAPATKVAEDTTTPATTTVADANAPAADANAPGATPGITALLASNTPQDNAVVSDTEDPNAAMLTALQRNATQPAVTNEVGYQQLVNALYPGSSESNAPDSGSNAPTASQEESTPAAPATPTPTDSTFTGLGGTLGDQEGDFPASIENQADGSTKVTEFDGTYRLFNTDGSIQKFDADGTPVIEITAKRDTTTEDTDPLGTFISGLNTDKVDVNATTDTTKDTTTDGTTPSGTNLTSLVKTLLPDINVPKVTKPIVDWVNNNSGLVGGALTGAAALAAMNGQNTINANPMDMGAGYGFNWNQSMGNGPQNGVYYGSQMLAPAYTKHAAEGGLMNAPQFIQPTVANNGIQMSQGGDPTNAVNMYAMGGIASLGHYSDGGRFLKGPGDGMSDDIPATIAGKQPARLANEEFVIPADVVSHLGNGSSEAGSKVLYKMMEQVRKARTGNAKQGKQINPEKFMPKVRG